MAHPFPTRAQHIQDGLLTPLAALPTPLEPMPRLRKILQARWPHASVPSLWVKRDDLTGLFLGGNKTRKLEVLLAQALAQGADTLLTVGAPQSNHARQTAAAAAKAGLACTLVLGGSAPRLENGNFLLDQILGAKILWAGDRDRLLVMDEAVEHLRQQGFCPFPITYGGSNAAGAAAYVMALGELHDQWDKTLPKPHIFVASSSGGTHAGLALGAKLLSFPAVHGISIDQPRAPFSHTVASLAQDAAALLGLRGVHMDPSEISLYDNYLGQGYGIVGPPEQDALLTVARAEGLLLDPVYTARAAAGLFDQISQNAFSASDTVLFWHTGGAPAVFAYGASLLPSQPPSEQP